MNARSEQPNVVKKGSYAEHRGCSAAYISKLIRLGKLAPPAVTPDGLIDVALADAMLGPASPQLSAGRDPAPRPDPDGDADAEAYASSRARREATNAKRAELELAELEGRLVDRAAVQREVEEMVRSLRDRVLNVPRDIAASVATMTDERAIEARITLALKAALTEAADETESPEDAAV
ncbi:hypothetical protein [Limobrevibacterium gyesilva]|uniref:Terminase small subunit n=1 Tax=Limobrevibacterium gyesilva TaxID=2991712 RepID=A0AA41YPK7_9PROT|nr:hypothetical protein [Limobrevibacterium gyesilva]MCW3477354.1 hypothetical protein [Limobrevibacterium gyesilva]